MNSEINIDALTSIQSAAGKIIKDNGKSVVVLTLTTATKPIELSLEEFDNIYRGFVKCWPAIKPLKDQVIDANRSETKLAKEAEKLKEKEAKDAKRKQDREAREAKVKAEKEAKAKKAAEAKAAKETKEKADREAKLKADKAKLKAASEKKAKDDAK
jgi:regulator of protease activity HflC (stomatin/prohibitin superfamily)